MGHARCQAAQQVEGDVAGRAQPVFHIVAENVKGPHVPDQVHESAVKEHEGEQGEDPLAQEKYADTWGTVNLAGTSP
jgi:heat shock protein HspQ